MKVINKGNDVAGGQVKLEWWAGHVVNCRCGFSAVLEAGDKENVKCTTERTPNGKRTAEIPCPTCGGVASYTNRA